MTLKEFKYYHRPVLIRETIQALRIKEDGVYVDCTVGGGGHSEKILEGLGKTGMLICMDKDNEALKVSRQRLSGIDSRGACRFIKSDFANIKRELKEIGVEQVDGIMADFGVSSHQLDENSRGFGYMQKGPLDMRMDLSALKTAEDVVNNYSEKEIAEILSGYGEERFAKRIASAIVRRRNEKPIKTTQELSETVKNAMPAYSRRENQHPSKRTFQAIRIEVNDELESIKKLLDDMPVLLKPGGRFAGISFHSLEDRLVKEAIRKLENPCECPKSFPICACGKKPVGKAVNKKVIVASFQETEANPRARSAKLRIFEKYEQGEEK